MQTTKAVIFIGRTKPNVVKECTEALCDWWEQNSKSRKKRASRTRRNTQSQNQGNRKSRCSCKDKNSEQQTDRENLVHPKVSCDCFKRQDRNDTRLRSVPGRRGSSPLGASLPEGRHLPQRTPGRGRTRSTAEATRQAETHEQNRTVLTSDAEWLKGRAANVAFGHQKHSSSVLLTSYIDKFIENTAVRVLPGAGSRLLSSSMGNAGSFSGSKAMVWACSSARNRATRRYHSHPTVASAQEVSQDIVFFRQVRSHKDALRALSRTVPGTVWEVAFSLTADIKTMLLPV